ncbi:hypothetical protein [Streptomyces katsurahamanus]|uniref:hypothetical protein n=1 Tax=Streptomyces katsurahamanus TaxID=2577098 RepID=UPI001E476BF8|nr:hypothetical protein [Streptomyces katsurahamanus]
MAGKRKTNPAGSSNALRGDALRVLGVLKVATADQIQRISSPHLTYRHTDKPTPSGRKTARGAGSSGGSHPMAVNETVIAMPRPKPDLKLLAGESAEAVTAARAVVDAPAGVGSIGSYGTGIPLPANGTWNARGKGGAQADIVLTAPQDKVPLAAPGRSFPPAASLTRVWD